MNKNLLYDVVVIGGGPGGSTAAIAAARGGAKTLLVEQNGYLGGALTAAGTGPQMTYHAGDTQVVRGIPDEMVRRMQALGFSPGHMEDFVGYASSVTPFDAEGMKVVLEAMVMEADADILYHTVYTGCTMEGRRIKSVQLYAKNGFFEAEAAVFVDASADADLAVHAGVPAQYGREEDNLAQPMTMNMKLYNVDREKLMDEVLEHWDDMLATIPFGHLRLIPRSGMQGAYSLIKKARAAGEFAVDRDMVLCFETNNPGEYIVNMTRVKKLSAVTAEGLTQAEIEGRRQCFEVLAFLRKYLPAFKNCVLHSTGPSIGIRESRKIDGVYKLTAEDLLQNRMFDDAVAMGGYPIDIHSPDGEKTNHQFLKKGSWYSVPYRCLVTNEVDNLIVTGRCISATHEACASVRLTPILMAISQGAGTAAAMAAQNGGQVRQVNTNALRSALRENGAFLETYPPNGGSTRRKPRPNPRRAKGFSRIDTPLHL